MVVSKCVLFVIILTTLVVGMSIKKENFTADGWFYNSPPEWFHKKKYDSSDWMTPYYPDQISIPTGCDMHYRGDNHDLNYFSSAYRFWRM